VNKQEVKIKIITILKNLYSRIYNWDNKRVVLIISSGRTGTNFMAHWFDSLSEEFYSVHEPSPDLFQLGIDKYRNKKTISLRELKRKRSLQLYKLNKSKRNIYIESNPNLLLLLPEINTIFKNVKIIFIKRDFQTYLLSAMNKSPDNSNKNYFYDETDPRLRLTAIDYKDQRFIDKFSDFTREEKIAWWWKISNEIIDDYMRNNNNSICVSFEELFDKNTSRTLSKLMQFLNLDDLKLTKENKEYFKNKKNTNTVKKIYSYDQINVELKNKLNEVIKT